MKASERYSRNWTIICRLTTFGGGKRCRGVLSHVEEAHRADKGGTTKFCSNRFCSRTACNPDRSGRHTFVTTLPAPTTASLPETGIRTVPAPEPACRWKCLPTQARDPGARWAGVHDTVMINARACVDDHALTDVGLCIDHAPAARKPPVSNPRVSPTALAAHEKTTRTWFVPQSR